MGAVFTILIIVTFLASVFEKIRIEYFNKDWWFEGKAILNEHVTEPEIKPPDPKQCFDNWEVSMIHSVTWDAKTKDTIEIVWKEDQDEYRPD